MAVRTGTVTVGATGATGIVPALNSNQLAYAPDSGSQTVVVTNLDGTNTAYLGGTTGVTGPSNGYALVKNASITVALSAGDAIYAIAVTGSPPVSFIATG